MQILQKKSQNYVNLNFDRTKSTQQNLNAFISMSITAVIVGSGVHFLVTQKWALRLVLILRKFDNYWYGQHLNERVGEKGETGKAEEEAEKSKKETGKTERSEEPKRRPKKLGKKPEKLRRPEEQGRSKKPGRSRKSRKGGWSYRRYCNRNISPKLLSFSRSTSDSKLSRLGPDKKNPRRLGLASW